MIDDDSYFDVCFICVWVSMGLEFWHSQMELAMLLVGASAVVNCGALHQ